MVSTATWKITCYSNTSLLWNGGCAYNVGSLNVVNSTICWNDAVEGVGGGVFNGGELDLTNVTFAYNNSVGDLSSAIFTIFEKRT